MNAVAARSFPLSLRLLLPIEFGDSPGPALDYVIRRHRDGEALAAFLLVVAEPVRQWEVLRFYSPEEVRRHFMARAEISLAESAAVLRRANVSCSVHFREAERVRGILDFAGEMDCQGIVTRRAPCFSGGLAARLRRCACPVPVIEVGGGG